MAAVIKVCKHCGENFDLYCTAKVRSGGLINECPSCVEELETETAVRYLGVQSGEGKGQGVTILGFDSKKDRDRYNSAWRGCSGANRGKACQLGGTLPTMGGMKFRKLGENFASANPKQKREDK